MLPGAELVEHRRRGGTVPPFRRRIAREECVSGLRHGARARQIDHPRQRRVIPSLRVDHMVRPHRGEVGESLGSRPVGRQVLRLRQLLCRGPQPPLLQQPVMMPGRIVPGPPVREIGRDPVLRHDIVPHAHGDEDVRGHVLRVGGVRRDLGVGAGRAQAKRGVRGVVI